MRVRVRILGLGLVPRLAVIWVSCHRIAMGMLELEHKRREEVHRALGWTAAAPTAAPDVGPQRVVDHRSSDAPGTIVP